jgi:hypothetical protein
LDGRKYPKNICFGSSATDCTRSVQPARKMITSVAGERGRSTAKNLVSSAHAINRRLEFIATLQSLASAWQRYRPNECDYLVTAPGIRGQSAASSTGGGSNGAESLVLSTTEGLATSTLSALQARLSPGRKSNRCRCSIGVGVQRQWSA